MDADNTAVVKFLLSKRADIEAAIRPARKTPLHLAAEKGNREVVDMLLKAGADRKKVDKDGHTPLRLATDAGHREVIELLRDSNGNGLVRAMKSYALKSEKTGPYYYLYIIITSSFRHKSLMIIIFINDEGKYYN